MEAPHIRFVQPALPSYRLDFFARLAAKYPGRVTVFASPSDLGPLTEFVRPAWAKALGAMKYPLPGVEWQPGALLVPLKKGDLLVVCGAPRCLSTLLLMLRARFVGAKTIWWGHYWSATTLTWRFRLRMLLLGLADGIAFYTNEEVEHYVARLGLPRGMEICGLDNGIDVVPIQQLRHRYRAKQRPERVLFLGRLIEKARLDLLLDALADPRLGTIRLAVLGSGPAEGALREHAIALGVGDRVEWISGTTDEVRIASVANQSRLFIYPGAVGLSLIHAMAYGLPAVVHDERWLHMPEIAAFGDGLTGRKFRAGDPKSLADAVWGCWNDVPALDAASAEAIRRSDHVYNTEVMMQRMASLLDKLGANACPPPSCGPTQ